MIVVVDYGMGNLGSILNMLKKIGTAAIVSSKPEDIADAEKLILPGVGAFDHGMKNLDGLGLIPLLEDRVLGAGTPTLGICLGMQLLTERSDEGTRPGLGWIKAETVRFKSETGHGKLRVPHMGWNTVRPARAGGLFDGLEIGARFYFVHSYYVQCHEPADVLATTTYGDEFVCAVRRGALSGVQFHPEKSHRYGMQLLRNFVEGV